MTTKTTTIGQDLDAAISAARSATWEKNPSTPTEKVIFAIENRFPTKGSLLTDLTETALNYSLSSAENTVTGLGTHLICQRAIAWLRREEKPITVDELRIHALTEAVRFAKYGHHSTSPMSNIVAEAEASAWAEIAEICGGIK